MLLPVEDPVEPAVPDDPVLLPAVAEADAVVAGPNVTLASIVLLSFFPANAAAKSAEHTLAAKVGGVSVDPVGAEVVKLLKAYPIDEIPGWAQEVPA